MKRVWVIITSDEYGNLGVGAPNHALYTSKSSAECVARAWANDTDRNSKKPMWIIQIEVPDVTQKGVTQVWP